MGAVRDVANILIVEDEIIIAADLEFRLTGQGYNISGKATTGEHALDMVELHKPDLVIMDIVLNGEQDGIKTAEIIRDKWSTPVVFLTAYADTDRLEQAKLTYPFGYLLKPFQDRDLKITVEMALYAARLDKERRKAEEALRQSEELYRRTVDSLEDAVHLVDSNLCIVLYNEKFKEWCELIGLENDIPGTPLENLFPFLNDQDMDEYKKVLETGRSIKIENETEIGGRMITAEVLKTPVVLADGSPGVLTQVKDITERKRLEKIQAARLRLVDYAAEHTVNELLQQFLDEAEALTGSEIGFFHFFEDDQDTISLQTWSTNTLNNMCDAAGGGLHYPLSKAGVWVDCVFERSAVIHNDYENLPHKRGLPEGHAPIIRELVVPVIRGEKIVAILGVGNKRVEYDEEDVKTVQQLADMAWETVAGKKAEEALRAGEKKFRSYITHAPYGIFVADENGNYLEVNEAAEKITGFSSDELLKMNLADLFAVDNRQKAWKHFETVITNGKASGDYAFVHKQGSLKYWTVEAVKLSDNRFLGFVRDITDRKLVEQALRENEKKYRLLADNARDVIWIRDMNLKLTYVSPSVELVRGYTPEEAMNQTLEEVLTPDSVKHAVETFAHIINQKENGIDFPESHTINLEHNCKDDSKIWMECKISYLIDSDGTPIGMLGVSRDVTDRK